MEISFEAIMLWDSILSLNWEKSQIVIFIISKYYRKKLNQVEINLGNQIFFSEKKVNILRRMLHIFLVESLPRRKDQNIEKRVETWYGKLSF